MPPEKSGNEFPFFPNFFPFWVEDSERYFFCELIPEAGQYDLRAGGLGAGSILGFSQPLISDHSIQKHFAGA